MRTVRLALVVAFASQSACSGNGSDADLVARAGALLFDGMGSYRRPITTQDPGAQRYFDQGMVLSFGFNHAEAIRCPGYALQRGAARRPGSARPSSRPGHTGEHG